MKTLIFLFVIFISAIAGAEDKILLTEGRFQLKSYKDTALINSELTEINVILLLDTETGSVWRYSGFKDQWEDSFLPTTIYVKKDKNLPPEKPLKNEVKKNP